MTDEAKPNTQPNAHESPQAGHTGGHEHDAPPEQKPISGAKAIVSIVILVLVAAVLAGWGLISRRNANTVLADRTTDLAAPAVIAVAPKQGAPVDSFVLPGNVTAYTDSPIYARTSGYLTKWYFDIGARVKKGALLAEIATPELDQQLAQAEADLVTSQATANNARIQADRYTGLVKTDAVSHQDTDTFVNQAAATSAAVKSAQANVQRLKELQSFEKVYAPFDGVVTARNIDTGQLITEGSTSELFHLQAIQTLRVYANLPQIYSGAAKRGQKIDLNFVEYPGKTYTGTLVRTADAIDPASRTLLVEVDVDNRAGQLLPGSLAQVHFKTPATGPTFIVPSSALIFRREGMRLGLVVDGNKAHLVPVLIGEDDGATVQIVSGLNAGDKVIQDPPDSLIEGEKVYVESPGGQANAGGK
ncbi:MAG TPA: efflux RND transporter periplasmic adaptor subunit [Terracidiphilus sp.]|jgi:RND family efflux transporter MFP subunit|nr:efflux RND transporter periplasmic adaptor subunit [Terracidiphilus sp.]